MRTTFRIDEDLMDTLRHEAAREKTSIGLVVNRLLRLALHDRARPGKHGPFRQKSFSMGKPFVDLTGANKLADELDDAELIRRMGCGH